VGLLVKELLLLPVKKLLAETMVTGSLGSCKNQ
jgi:hypothetical protein